MYIYIYPGNIKDTKAESCPWLVVTLRKGCRTHLRRSFHLRQFFWGHQGHSKNCGRLVVSVDHLSLSLFCFLSWIPHQWTYLDQSSAWLFQPFISCWSMFFRSIVSLFPGTNGSNFVTGSFRVTILSWVKLGWLLDNLEYIRL